LKLLRYIAFCLNFAELHGSKSGGAPKVILFDIIQFLIWKNFAKKDAKSLILVNRPISDQKRSSAIRDNGLPCGYSEVISKKYSFCEFFEECSQNVPFQKHFDLICL
jgi:hypothetical protein